MIDDKTAVNEKYVSLLLDYIESTFQATEIYLYALLEKREITYDMLWALFKPNAEVYTTCRGTDASRCVLYNHCEEMEPGAIGGVQNTI